VYIAGCDCSRAWDVAVSVVYAATTVSVAASNAAFPATDRAVCGSPTPTVIDTSTRAGDAMAPDANGTSQSAQTYTVVH